MTPNFSLRQLGYLIAVADLGSMTAAAEAECVSQAAISGGIHDLERRLGAQLLVRRPGHGVSVTEAGLGVLADARRVLAAAEDLQSSARAPGAELRGTLKLGCLTTLAPLYLPRLYGSFGVEHPTIEMTVLEGPQEVLGRALTSGACELALTYDSDLPAGLATEVIRRHRPYALLAAGHRLADQPSVSIEELVEEPMISYSQGPMPHDTEQLFQQVGATPRIVRTSSNIEVVRSLVARGLGWTHLLQRWPLDVSLEGMPLICVPIVGQVPVHSVVAAWPEQDRLSRRAAAVISFLHETARQVTVFGDNDAVAETADQNGAPAAT